MGDQEIVAEAESPDDVQLMVDLPPMLRAQPVAVPIPRSLLHQLSQKGVGIRRGGR